MSGFSSGGFSFSYTAAEERAVEQGWDLDRRAWRALALIAAEFESDPTSVQCFDLRLVEETKTIVKEARALDPRLPPLHEKRMA